MPKFTIKLEFEKGHIMDDLYQQIADLNALIDLVPGYSEDQARVIAGRIADRITKRIKITPPSKGN